MRKICAKVLLYPDLPGFALSLSIPSANLTETNSSHFVWLAVLTMNLFNSSILGLIAASMFWLPPHLNLASFAQLKANSLITTHDHPSTNEDLRTVYVRGIPVITFRGSDLASKSQQFIALLNQALQEGWSADTIQPAWEQGRYVIKFGDRSQWVLDQSMTFPESSQNPAQDTLMITNRLRRLLGGAAPLSTIANAPTPSDNLIARVVRVISGIASWYGPGFHGNRSASGEIFDQNALTAAHLTLPFGTQVRVTNLSNGQSVVVRINDRGPFTGNRVIDVSKAAAQRIGMTGTGVAPVKLEVLGRPN